MKKLDTQQKRWVGIVAVLLAVILALGITLGVATKWGKDLDNLTPKKEEAALGNVGGGMVVGEAEETGDSGLSLLSAEIPVAQYEEYGIAPIAESAFTVTATVKDSSGSAALDDSMQKFKWEMGWNGGSGTGEPSTYVTMSESGGKTATFSCLGAFTTQIVVTCTWTINTEVTAQVTLDYAKKLESITVSYQVDRLVQAGKTELTEKQITFGDSSVQSVTESQRHGLKFGNTSTIGGTAGTTAGNWTDTIVKFGKSTVNFGTVGSIDNEVPSSGAVRISIYFDESFVSALQSCGDMGGLSGLAGGMPTSESAAVRLKIGEEFEVGQYDFLKWIVTNNNAQSLSGFESVFGQLGTPPADLIPAQNILGALEKGHVVFVVTVDPVYGDAVKAKFQFDIDVEDLTGKLQLSSSSHIF